MAERKIELADQAASAEGEQLLAQSDDLLFEFGASLVGLMRGGARVFDQATQAVLLKAAQPFAHGAHRGLEEASRGLNADLPSRLDQTQAMIVGVLHFADQGEVGSGHGDECNFVVRAFWRGRAEVVLSAEGCEEMGAAPSSAPPSPSPPQRSRFFSSFRRLSLMHFNFARGIPCE